jgi:hypothetical protein
LIYCFGPQFEKSLQYGNLKTLNLKNNANIPPTECQKLIKWSKDYKFSNSILLDPIIEHDHSLLYMTNQCLYYDEMLKQIILENKIFLEMFKKMLVNRHKVINLKLPRELLLKICRQLMMGKSDKNVYTDDVSMGVVSTMLKRNCFGVVNVNFGYNVFLKYIHI